MAGPERKPDPALKESLLAEGPHYRFFAAVQLLHRLDPDSVPVGELGPFAREALRFRHSPALVFHPGDVESIQFRENGQAELTSTFLGLYGASSPLAICFSEDVIRAEDADETSLRSFYDLFHHRALSLYYRAWKKYRLHTGFRLESEDPSSRRMQCFVGLDGHGTVAESGLGRREVLALAPLLAMRARPPRVLLAALRRLLPGVPVQIEQFILRRATIDQSDRMRLGTACNQLGVDYTLGARVLDRSARFRLVLGPVDYDQCETFMPGGSRYPTVRKAVEQFTRGTLECEVDVILKQDESPGYCLGNPRGGTLGVSTRLGRGTTGRQSCMRTVISNDPSEARASLIEMPAA